MPFLLFLIAATALWVVARKWTRRPTMDVPLVSPKGTYDFASLLVKGYRAVSWTANEFKDQGITARD